MDRRVWIGTGGGLLVGFLIGYFVSTARPVVPAPLTPVAPVPAIPAPGAAPDSLAIQQAIFAAQQAVERNPENLQAWIALGNGYFDTQQPEKAIEAYGKALQLDPRNPDVLTDQGIMYRDTGAFDKAVANFEKANRIDPRHMQSLYNLGIVYAHHLNAKDKALKAWKKIIETDPASKQAELSRRAIEEFSKTGIPH